MKTLPISLAIVLTVFVSLESDAQSKRGSGEQRTGKASATKAPATERSKEAVRAPAANAPSPAKDAQPARPSRGSAPSTHEMRLLRKPHREYHITAQDGPLTRPVDLNWPPPIYVAASGSDWTYETGSTVIVDSPGPPAPYTGPPQQRMRRPVQVDLSDCVESPDHAGYDFEEKRVVSCEDTTVDIYLSHGEKVGFSFIVPEDTEIKDAGEHGSVLSVTRFKPSQWAENHAVPITNGHVYIVWSYTGDFYMVRVNEIRDQSVSLEWVWHSTLSRKEAEDHESKREDERPGKTDSRKAPGPYFGK